MEEKAPSAGQSALYYGLLLGVLIILTHLIMYLAEIHKETYAGIIGFAIYLVAVIMVQLDFRNKKLGGFISYGKAVKVGFLSILFSSIIAAIYMFIYHSAINTGEAQQNLIEAQQRIYEYGLSAGQEASQLKMQEYIHTPIGYALASILWYSLIGIIMVLITSIFVKKEEKVSLQ